jgi:hypothetical protein
VKHGGFQFVSIIVYFVGVQSNSTNGGVKRTIYSLGILCFVYFKGSRGWTWMKGETMEVMIGQVLTRRGNGVKDYNGKREDNGMPIGRPKMLPAMFTIA